MKNLKIQLSCSLHLADYFLENRKTKSKFVDLKSLHPDCAGRFPQICKAKFKTKTVNVCGEELTFCLACAYELESRANRAMAEPPQKHYWQNYHEYNHLHIRFDGGEKENYTSKVLNGVEGQKRGIKSQSFKNGRKSRYV